MIVRVWEAGVAPPAYALKAKEAELSVRAPGFEPPVTSRVMLYTRYPWLEFTRRTLVYLPTGRLAGDTDIVNTQGVEGLLVVAETQAAPSGSKVTATLGWL